MTTLDSMLTRLDRSATWLQDAACAGRTDVDWDPPNNNSARVRYQLAAPAMRLCGSCPVRQACLQDALDTPAGEDHGIRGGLTRAQRSELRKGERIRNLAEKVAVQKRVERWRALMADGYSREEAAYRVGGTASALDRAWARQKAREAASA